MCVCVSRYIEEGRKVCIVCIYYIRIYMFMHMCVSKYIGEWIWIGYIQRLWGRLWGLYSEHQKCIYIYIYVYLWMSAAVHHLFTLHWMKDDFLGDIFRPTFFISRNFNIIFSEELLRIINDIHVDTSWYIIVFIYIRLYIHKYIY